ncbi:MAG TPA: sialate O-acetylesterase [Bacteroidia bacterium]|nr:sialate O-acetylesterase [Bacteroidia bacterium]
MRFKLVNSIFFVALLVCFFSKCSSNVASNNNKSDTNLVKDSAYDVFVVAGQSNTYWGQGYDSIKDKEAEGIYQLGRLAPNDLKIIQAKEPLHHFNPKADRIGFALTFAKLYQTYIQKKNDILIIPCGMDNTGFDGEGWHRKDFLYDNAISRINYVFKKYPKSNLKAILWHQGEKDVNYKNYQRDLDTLIAQFRRDIIGANKTTPFILGGMVPYWTELKPERKHQQQIIKETVNRIPATAYVDPYLPQKIQKPNNNQDTLHYNADGQREMGKRYFEVYKNMVKSSK